MQMYTQTKEQIEVNADAGRKLILTQLAKDGILSQEQYDKYHQNYFVVLKKPSIISSIWNKLLKKADEESFILVEQKTLEADKEDK